ncbi:hypothetical protein [Moorena sp. SIO2C4]|uniref:hypothetical protein n=1 Tax=Moorena sp. SIO2C4 TaxID=2607824 RepID=UPI0002EC127C|nr:hypothetical protein [Moorena sp. SIO2C4]NES45657.1 hypothetical protein [Moorena sp. SIO2C4]
MNGREAIDQGKSQKSNPNFQQMALLTLSSKWNRICLDAVAHGGDPQDRAASLFGHYRF